MVLLAAYAGLRKGECFGLARRHLDLRTKPPTVTVERTRIETASLGMIFQAPNQGSMARLGHASPAAALRYQHAASTRDAEVTTAVDALRRLPA